MEIHIQADLTCSVSRVSVVHQQVEGLVAKPDDPGSSPGTYTMEGENGLLEVVL